MPELTSGPLALIVTAVLGYLLGSVPFGLVVTRAMGLGDPRGIGSGNIGATNVLRTGSKPAALATLILDGGKGAVAVLIARAMAGPDAAQLAGLAAFLGHLFPVWLKFRGGKGVATFLGTVLALAWPVGIASCATMAGRRRRHPAFVAGRACVGGAGCGLGGLSWPRGHVRPDPVPCHAGLLAAPHEHRPDHVRHRTEDRPQVIARR